MAKQIELYFFLTHRILERHFLKVFLERLCAIQGGKWLPERYNNYSPAKKNFDIRAVEDVVELWISGGIGIVLKRLSHPKYDLDFEGEHPNLLVKNELFLRADRSIFASNEGIESFLDFATSLYVLLRPVHGFCAHERDYLSKNLRVYEMGEDTVEEWVGRDLQIALRGVYWANWFSPKYVRFFGEEKFKSLPCYRVSRLEDGGYLVILSRSPFEFANVDTKSAESRIMKHLGSEAFFDIKQLNKLTKSPWEDSSQSRIQ